MQLTKIALDNFKCFERVSIDCPKFTILTGANSSGKSSILISILGALQTKGYPFYYSPNGTYINMGDFAELAHKHNHNASVRVALTLQHRSQPGQINLDSTFTEDHKTRVPKLARLIYRGIDLGLTINRTANGYEASFHYDPSKDPMRTVRESADFVAFADSLDNYLVKAFERDKARAKGRKRKSSRKTTVSEPPDFRGAFFPKRTGGSYCFKTLPGLLDSAGNAFLHRRLKEITEHTSDFERRWNYVSSFRLAPQRTYYQRTKAALKVDTFGDNWIDQVVEWEQSGAKEYQELTRICRGLGLIATIKVKRYGGGRYEIRVRPHGHTVEASLADVGFGVSQFLPLVVADLQLGKNSTFMTSQPEIHLHPRIQAEYVNHLVNSAKRNGKRYIIETHSEYLLNRFRLLIVKGRIKPEDVGVYYLARQKERVRNYRLNFRKDGSIGGAPKDFFATYMMDTMQIALNAKS